MTTDAGRGRPATSPDRLAASRERLAARQAALTAALVAGAPPPDGIDDRLFGAAKSALLNKRAGEVAHTWPRLAAGLGARWRQQFRAWAAGRPPRGSLCDGFDFARHLAVTGGLPGSATAELVAREGFWVYDGETPPRPRRVPPFARPWVGRLRVRMLTRSSRSASRRDRDALS
jgi:hypothetical protein